VKKKVHPKYEEVSISCACGNSFITKSCRCGDKELKIEICSNCHPFYTGKQKILDSAGRVEKFMKKYKSK